MRKTKVPVKEIRDGEAGFTLLELLVVLAILGMIALFAVPQAVKFLSGAKSDAAQIQVNNLSSILELYRVETGRYPASNEGLAALLDKPADAKGWNGPYVKKAEMLADPWGRPYQYRFPGNHGAFDLWSLGADGTEGGSGEDADVVSW